MEIFFIYAPALSVVVGSQAWETQGNSWHRAATEMEDCTLDTSRKGKKLISIGFYFFLSVALVHDTDDPERIHELVCLEPLCMQLSHCHQQKTQKCLAAD